MFVSVRTLNSFRLPVWEANICFVMFCHPFVCKIFYIHVMQWENNYIMQTSFGIIVDPNILNHREVIYELRKYHGMSYFAKSRN